MSTSHQCSGVQLLHYRGVTHQGRGVGGAAEATPCELTEKLYERRYRWAEVTDQFGELLHYRAARRRDE
jgi:hypothetical protein